MRSSENIFSLLMVRFGSVTYWDFLKLKFEVVLCIHQDRLQ
jgi:hypothetical protein